VSCQLLTGPSTAMLCRYADELIRPCPDDNCDVPAGAVVLPGFACAAI
jgi:hypothetical protein